MSSDRKDRRTVLHGIDQSAPTFAKLPGRGHQGSRCYQEDCRNSWLYDCDLEAWLPDGWVCAEWKFSVHGGAQGFISLDLQLPENTIITHGFYEVLDPVTSAGSAEYGFKIESAAGTEDLLAVANLSTNQAALGLDDLIPDSTAANMVKLTEARWLKMRIEAADLTGGHIAVYLLCARGLERTEVSSSSSSSSNSSSSSSTSSASSASSNSSSSSSGSSSSISSVSASSSSPSSSSSSSSSEKSSSSVSSSSSSSSSNSSSSSSNEPA